MPHPSAPFAMPSWLLKTHRVLTVPLRKFPTLFLVDRVCPIRHCRLGQIPVGIDRERPFQFTEQRVAVSNLLSCHFEGRSLFLFFILFRSPFSCPKLLGCQIRMLIIQRLKNFDKNLTHYSSSRSSVPFKLLAWHLIHHSSNGIVYLSRDALKRAYNLLCRVSIHRFGPYSLYRRLKIGSHWLTEIVNAARAV